MLQFLNEERKAGVEVNMPLSQDLASVIVDALAGLIPEKDLAKAEEIIEEEIRVRLIMLDITE